MDESNHGTPLTADDPRRLGDYELTGRLGEGGMGTVYLGSTPQGREVAVKVIRTELATDDDFLARFRDEALLARRVSPFCTAQVVDYGMQGTTPYLVTEFVDGASLEEVVHRQGGLPPSTVHGIAVGVAAALTAIHAAGLMHRDLKPTNVLLSQSGPRVIDFGIAKPTEDTTGRRSTVGVLVGTPGWIAPEQLTGGEVTTSVDVWTWGCLVAYAANGRHPFGKGNAAAVAFRALHERPDLGELVAPLDRLVSSALAPDPADRPKAQALLLSLVGGDSDAGGADLPARDMTAYIGTTWTPPPPPPGSRPAPGIGAPGAGPRDTGPRGAGRPMPGPRTAGSGPMAYPPGPHPSGPRPVPGRPSGPMQPRYPSGPTAGAARPAPGPPGMMPRQVGRTPPVPQGRTGPDEGRLLRGVLIGGFAGLCVVFAIVAFIALRG